MGISITVTHAIIAIRQDNQINNMIQTRIKYTLLFIWLYLSGTLVYGQVALDTIGGEVSFKTSQSIYVKFESTKDIKVGDTLYMVIGQTAIPALIVKYISSTSCVGTPLTDQTIEKGTQITARVQTKKESPKAPVVNHELNPVIKEAQGIPETEEVKAAESQKRPAKKIEKLQGRIMAASYLNYSDHPQYDKQRMRYTLTFNANHIGNTGLSAESYISFRHTLNEWQDVKDNFKQAFKIYSLALQYDVNESTRFWFGRKINFNISNIGAIDGIQAEKSWNKTLVGAFAGTRPDLTDYGFNFDLKQYGAYIGNTIEGKNGSIQNTLAIAEQRNHNATDRRFIYLQHLNSAIKRINIFTSFEFDLYKVVNEKPKNTFDITSVYFSLRYRASDKLSLFGSYDARKNIIYYETYKNFIDQLLEDETRQGFRFSFNYHPFKKITLGSSAGYRFQKGNPTPSTNMNNYLTISRVPGINASATVSATLIHSVYLDGLIYGVRTSRDIINGKLYGELEFRVVEYKYKSVEFPLKQYIAAANISWRIKKKLSFAFNYEAEIQNKKITSRIYTNIIQRF